MHVLALWDAGLSMYQFYEEYLVYGPVHGTCYTCMTLAWQIYPADLCLDLWTLLSPETKLAHSLKARNRTARHSFYRAGDTWLTSLFCTCRDWSLVLTVIAAEWGRSKVGESRRRLGRVRGERFDDPSFEEMSLVVSDLSYLIEAAARSPNLVLPLYNPRTYKTRLPGLEYMLRLLWHIEWRIELLRSRPQPRTFPLIGYFWSQASGQDRKVNEMEATGEPRLGNKTE